MAINQKIFEKKIVQHKKLAGEINSSKDFFELSNGFKAQYTRQGKELALAWANFKCEIKGCEKETDLNWHHLITRNNCRIDMRKYFTQRHYFYNISILCSHHHSKIHKFVEQVAGLKGISEKKILLVKKKFGVI